MRHSTLVPVVFVAVLAFLLAPACGGGSDNVQYRNEGNSAPALEVTSTALPQLESGETVDWEIPMAGGCGGPYTVEVIQGALPEGVGIDDADGAHRLTGILLESGTFTFELKITDAGCDPFYSTTAAFLWTVGQGPVRIVAVDPPLIPVAQFNDPAKYNDVDALETTVYGKRVVFNLICAGGVPPVSGYVCTLVDDPADPDDDLGLPTGAYFPPNSASIIAEPIQVGPNGKPFRITVQVTDAVGNTSRRKFQWKIDTPPIIIANQTLADGKAGANYSDQMQVVDGVPPILFELVDDIPGPNADPTDGNDHDDIDFTPSPPVVLTTEEGKGIVFSPTGPATDARLQATGGRTTYPGASVSGPYSPFPPEGVYMNDEAAGAGAFVGIPRRHGQFTIYVHAFSSLVPNERGQHAFQHYNFKILPSEPPVGTAPAFDMDPSWTVEKAWPAPPALPTVPEFEVGAAYDPEADGIPGLTLLAQGGVPSDGWLDAPHKTQRNPDFTYPAGAYKWTSDWDPNSLGLPNPPAGIGFDPAGQVLVTNGSLLLRTGARPVEIEVRDFQLPDTDENNKASLFNYSVGPDVAIITHSTTSTSEYDFWWYTSQRFGFNDTEMTIQKFEIFASGPQRNPLGASELAATHAVPAAANLGAATNPIGALLSGATGGDANLDLLRCVVNATGWWDDLHAMNPKSARPFTHTDPGRTDIPYGEFGNSYSNMGNHQVAASAVDLPDAPSVTADPAAGIYDNGGQMYHFESTNRFGMFVVRPDAKIYVPFAMEKGTWTGFGDGILFAKGTNQHSALRTVQMTVSPDGRFGSMKLKTNHTNLYEHASASGILFFSLTGEKVFGESSPGANDGETYRIVTTSDAGLSYGGNEIFYASSMALTNDHLYYLIGTQSPPAYNYTSSSYMYYQAWSGHFLMRCPIAAGTPGPLTGSGNWTQTSSTPMQTVFHHHGPNSTTSYTGGLIETYTGFGIWPYHRYWMEDGMNFNEHNVAPTPFRVSANGEAVAFYAGSNYSSTSGTLVYSTFAWVDTNGAGPVQVTDSRRHHGTASARGYTTLHGPDEYANWGRFHGPTPGIEISDDGTQVACVYNTYSGTMYSSASYSSSSNNWRDAREDVVLAQESGGSWSEKEVTKNTFGTSHFWRFGCLAFTADGSGLVFWGGAPLYQSSYTSSYSYNESLHFMGAFYIHDVTDTDTVTSMQATSDGGSSDGVKTYTSTSKFNPSSTSGINNRFGAMHPYGGFMSKNRDFMYVVSGSAKSSSNNTAYTLLGLNVSTVSSGTINGHTNGRGFIPASWPSRRGFMPSYYYYYGMYYPLRQGYLPNNVQGIGQQVMAKDTGWVFWGANYQNYGPSNSGSVSYGQFAYPTYYNYGYGYGGLGIYGFDADVGGPVAQVSKSTWLSSSTSPYALLGHIEVARDGTKLVYTYMPQTSTHYRNQERVRWAKNIQFDATTGAIQGFSESDDAGEFESSNGRVSAVMAIVPGGRDIYYAYKSGSSNENDKEFLRQRWNATTGQWDKTTTGTAGTGRINILWAAR